MVPKPKLRVVLPLLTVGIAFLPNLGAVNAIEGKQIGSPEGGNGRHHKPNDRFHFSFGV